MSLLTGSPKKEEVINQLSIMKKDFLSSLKECSSLSAWSSFILKKFLNLAADSLFVELPPLIDY